MSKPTGDDEETLKSDNQSASKPDQEDAVENSDEPEESDLDVATKSTDSDQLQERLTAAELAAEKARDDLLRVQAEMQNLRRRTEQDVESCLLYTSPSPRDS